MGAVYVPGLVVHSLLSKNSSPEPAPLTSEPGLGGNPTQEGGQRAAFFNYASQDAHAAYSGHRQESRLRGRARAVALERTP